MNRAVSHTRIVAPRGKRREDYLRVIYEILEEKGYARVKDIAEKLGVTMPTVVEALKKLEKEGLVIYRRRSITLTDKGASRARELNARHKALKKFLMLLLNIDEEEAEREACYIEHVVSEKTLKRIQQFIEFTDSCPLNIPRFLKHLYYYYEYGSRHLECERCIQLKSSDDE